MNKYKEKGFTLVELLVVIAIIGILVTIVIVAVDPAKRIQDAQDARRRSDLLALKAAFQLYYNDNKSYPSAVPYTAGSSWTGSGSTYMKQVPSDPTTGGSYPYAATGCVSGLCTDYTIGAVLSHSNGTDDSNTITKCSSGTPISTNVKYEVCND